MQKDTRLSLAIQREIEHRHARLGSEINKSMDEPGFRTIVGKAGMVKEKSQVRIALRLGLNLLPFVKEELSEHSGAEHPEVVSSTFAE